MSRRLRGDEDVPEWVKGPADGDAERPEPHIPHVMWEDRAFEAILGPDGGVLAWIDVDERPVVGFRPR